MGYRQYAYAVRGKRVNDRVREARGQFAAHRTAQNRGGARVFENPCNADLDFVYKCA
jgi:hypothetical protein